MSQIKVSCNQLDNQVDIQFQPDIKHWGCVDFESLFEDLDDEICKQKDVKVTQNNLQSIIDQWEATNSLWVKELH